MTTDVTEGKLKALYEALSGGNVVTFKNKATVERTPSGGIKVTRRWGPFSIPRTFAAQRMAEAYDCALNGIPTEPGPSAPFWADGKRAPRPEWEECPF